MKTRFLLLGLIFAFMIISCTQSEPDSGLAGNGKVKLNVRLIDAPADYLEVNIDLMDVQINAQDGDKGWTSLGGVKPGIYNLLDFTAGVDTLIATDYLKPGYYSQIRLVLGDNNSIKAKIGGKDIGKGMKVPSGSTSGLKLNLHKELVEDAIYTVLLDFDAAKSIVAKGNGEFSLKPVIRMIMEQTETGAIKGKVTNENVGGFVYLYATLPKDTIASSYLNEFGEYMLKGINPGTYGLRIVPGDTTLLQKKDTTGVKVFAGQVTTLPNIKLDPK